MTIPVERCRAVNNTREFLMKLLDPKQTPKIPKSIRKEAYWCLRHFPHEYEMEMTSKKYPEMWGDKKKT